MNLHQLRSICQVADSKLNITRAASALHTTQPGVSKQLSSLERELGVDIVLRQGNRIVAFTPAGEAILKTARRILNDVRAIRLIGEDFGSRETGRLVIATTGRDRGLKAIDVANLFESNVACLILRGNQAVPRHAADFAALLVPRWTRIEIDRVLVTGNVPRYPVVVYPQPRR